MSSLSPDEYLYKSMDTGMNTLEKIDRENSSIRSVASLFGQRCVENVRRLTYCPILLSASTLASLPMALATYPMESGVTPSQYFQPIPTSAMSSDQAQNILYSVGNATGWFNIKWWVDRGMLIRSGKEDLECLGNLSWAVSNLGALSAGEYSGAAGTLALLPTAGALIGAPSAELWVIFQLFPIAGLLTMFLSIGGTITPTSARDYDLRNMSYGGMISTDWTQERRKTSHPLDESRLRDVQRGTDPGSLSSSNSQAKSMSAAHDELSTEVPPNDSKTTCDARMFAERVDRRARDDAGGNSHTRILLAAVLQLIFFGAILIVLWYGQRGSVISWWCRVRSMICFPAHMSQLTMADLGLDVFLAFLGNHRLDL